MTESSKKSEQELHCKKMQAQKEKVSARIAAADIERSVAILLTANGKAKPSSAFDPVVLDELIHMFAYKYFDPGKVICTLNNRPQERSVVVIDPGGGRELREIIDTISEVKDTQHAYRSALRANVCLS